LPVDPSGTVPETWDPATGYASVQKSESVPQDGVLPAGFASEVRSLADKPRCELD
jgi:hypothetical protein